MNTPQLILFAAAGLVLVFTLTFFVGYRLNNYGCVDVAWSYAIGAVGLFYAWHGEGWTPRREILALLVAAWSFRLGTHILQRLVRTHPAEDPRYHELRKNWHGSIALKMFGVFMLQAALVLVLATPLLETAQNPASRFHPLEFVGVLLWICAIVGEAVADRQLTAFKRDSANRGKVCAVGLWRYSRHPNYFCEWLVWVAAFLFALPAPRGWLGFVAPLAMLIFLAGVTGIPPTERQSVRSKGDLYRRYQATTSAFFPWPPREASGGY